MGSSVDTGSIGKHRFHRRKKLTVTLGSIMTHSVHDIHSGQSFQCNHWRHWSHRRHRRHRSHRSQESNLQVGYLTRRWPKGPANLVVSLSVYVYVLYLHRGFVLYGLAARSYKTKCGGECASVLKNSLLACTRALVTQSGGLSGGFHSSKNGFPPARAP